MRSRLVLAEDNALLRAGLTQLLEGSGFEVVHAVDNAVTLDAALGDPDVEGAVLDVGCLLYTSDAADE